MIKALGTLLAWPLRALVWLYRYTISPWLGNNCRYEPSCSAYALEALRRYGAFRGTWLAVKRIGRCHPWGGSGFDPVPGKEEDPVEPDDEKVSHDNSKERTSVLNHAYGFISRGNRAGGLKHVHEWLEQDPEPNTAWPWFLGQMLRWENPEPALVFAQQYLGRLLRDEDYVLAVKLMMRCRLINAAFKPLPDDRALALEAAERCNNEELKKIL